MSKFLAKMERKYGKYAIQNLPMLLIICYGFGYLLQLLKPEFTALLSLNPYAICHGQVWRLFSWILIPPGSFSLLTVIVLYFYYSIGRTLQRTWGAFKFNVYIFSGLIFTVLGSFLIYVYFLVVLSPSEFMQAEQSAAIFYNAIGYGNEMLSAYGGSFFYAQVFSEFSTYYVSLSIFLAFAMMYPDSIVYIFFVIPLKMKVMGIIYVALMVYQIISAFVYNGQLTFTRGIITLVVIGSSLLNTLICFVMFKKRTFVSPQQIKRQHEFKSKIRKASTSNGVTRHKCAICGRTEQDAPDLAFRFCSKCDGNYEYCSEHIFTHEHIKRD